MHSKFAIQLTKDLAVLTFELSGDQTHTSSGEVDRNSFDPLKRRSESLGPIERFRVIDFTVYHLKSTSFFDIEATRRGRSHLETVQVTRGTVVSIEDSM